MHNSYILGHNSYGMLLQTHYSAQVYLFRSQLLNSTFSRNTLIYQKTKHAKVRISTITALIKSTFLLITHKPLHLALALLKRNQIYTHRSIFRHDKATLKSVLLRWVIKISATQRKPNCNYQIQLILYFILYTIIGQQLLQFCQISQMGMHLARRKTTLQKQQQHYCNTKISPTTLQIHL